MAAAIKLTCFHDWPSRTGWSPLVVRPSPSSHFGRRRKLFSLIAPGPILRPQAGLFLGTLHRLRVGVTALAEIPH